MDLAIPIFDNEKIYNIVEIKKPRTGVINNTYEAAQRGNVFKAMIVFLSGCIESIRSLDGDIIENPSEIKRLCGIMPYTSAEAVSISIMATINENDSIEGIYTCPRCGNKVIAEYDKVLEVDTRDKIQDLETIYMEGYNNSIIVNLEEPIKLKNARNGEVIDMVESFEMRYPTLNDCMLAAHNMSSGQELKVQIKAYINSLVSVNGMSVQKNWISAWGKLLFDNLYPKSMLYISKEISKYGMKKTVEKTCNECDKVWEVTINTSNFFASGLQAQ